MAKFDLAAAMGLQSVSKLDTETKMIDLSLIDPHPGNFFEVESDITDLAESIEINGLLQPLVVTPSSDGRYRTIAGHRRRMALLKLAEDQPEKWQRVPCMVTHPASPELEELALIQTNTEAREIGWSEKNKAATRVEAILVKLQQEQGVKLPGKMRANVAKIIKTSESQIARAKFINENLCKEAKKLNLNDSTAYKLSHLPEKDQRALADHYKNNSCRLTTSAIKDYQDNIAAGKDPFFVTPYVRYCYHTKGTPPCIRPDFFENHKKQCGHSTCCIYCNKRIDCSDACVRIQKDIENKKTGFFYQLGQRIRSFRIDHGIPEKEAAKLFGNYDDMIVCETGLTQINIHSFVDFCMKYGASADDLLGLSEKT